MTNNNDEYEYLKLIERILDNNSYKDDRTGTGTYSNFIETMRFNIRDGTLPLLTTKKVNFKNVLIELLFFIKGKTDNKYLTDKNVNIWTGNSTKEYFSRYNISREEGDLGPIYGFQWRHFGANYTTCHANYDGKGIDQLKWVINEIKRNPDSRRLIVSAWNPAQINEMALPPCHVLFQFYVKNNELSCVLYQRSGDVGLGVPYNIASYATLVHIIAYITGLKTGEFVHVIADAHIYKNHVDQLREQILRTPYEFPKLKIEPKRKISSIEDFEFEDFEVVDYKSHPAIIMEMAV